MEDFLKEKHIQFIAELDNRRNDLAYWQTEHLRISGVYWGLTALDLLGSLESLNKEQVIKFVVDCQQQDGGFGGHPDHDSHLLYTLSAIQILALYPDEGIFEKINVDKVVTFVASLQDPTTGAFCGDEWGEYDTRFSYCAIACLKLLNRLEAINVEMALDYVLKCQNKDGGFGTTIGAESHSGQIFCCLGVLSMLQALNRINPDMLSWWLCERQLPNGGLNGRPEKKEDVCYSWWVLSSLCMLKRQHWIDKEALKKFILTCQDSELGGFADRPGDLPDVFHTLFGIAGLSMLDFEGIDEAVDPVYCLPVKVTKRLGIYCLSDN